MMFRGITYVIPCGGRKLDHAAPAAELYVGQHFRHALTNVQRLAEQDAADGQLARILILSALHGLVELDTVLEPYDQRMDQPGSITAEVLAEQALAFGIDWGSAVYAFLPRPYLARLDEALKTLDVYVQDVYEACAGIGDQRRVLSIVGRSPAVAPMPDGPGPVVWIGADTNGFAWGLPILVSYGRLRDAKTLPVATAEWVCDSRGFAEVAEHGEWTIPAAKYAADLNRYAREIGHLRWAAPQDWPASAKLLARTGLTEEEHQARTIASVIELRALVTEVDVLAVVTGKDLAGYLRHVRMYAAAGIDLRSEQLVGVGALVGRPAAEVAEIVRALHAVGVTRLHGFGVKGAMLDLIGNQVVSVDSANWSREARNETDACPHGLTAWERNCRVAAQEWAVRQRERAAGSTIQEHLPFALV